MFEILESKLQLHQRFDVLYVVDGYIATFYDYDGDHEIAHAYGETVIRATQNLEHLIKDYEHGPR